VFFIFVVIEQQGFWLEEIGVAVSAVALLALAAASLKVTERQNESGDAEC
jgi:hypothetical protein